ncbi:MAG: DUF5710 domain-containing protein [Sulfurovum sp.]|nr:DUF5710 domain-containing protein [Sulfurovum sp.]
MIDKIYLRVKFAEKDLVKSLGAKWDNEAKGWYVTADCFNSQFLKWLPLANYYPPFYILEGKRKCWKCNQETKIIAFTSKKIVEFDFIDCFYDEQCEDGTDYTSIQEYFKELEFYNYPLLTSLDLDENYTIKQYVTSNYPLYKKQYSKTTQSLYYANSCEHCGKLQGDFFMNEADSPFFDIRNPNLKKIKILEKEILSLNCDYSLTIYP